MTLWFSATAVLPSLQRAWGLSATGAAWLTAAVQLGFVVGALGSALTNLPDVLPPRRMLWLSALGGALANLVLALAVASVGPALVLRFLTGVFLAGVYPPRYPPAVYRDLVIDFYSANYFHQKNHAAAAS